MGIMWLTVSVMNINSNLMKIVTAVVTVLFNYIASKLIIFRKKVDS
jgi:putative flippase GtrA